MGLDKNSLVLSRQSKFLSKPISAVPHPFQPYSIFFVLDIRRQTETSKEIKNDHSNKMLLVKKLQNV